MPYINQMTEPEAQAELTKLVGKKVKFISYETGYCTLTIHFMDGTNLDINVYDGCGQFVVEIEGGQ